MSGDENSTGVDTRGGVIGRSPYLFRLSSGVSFMEIRRPRARVVRIVRDFTCEIAWFTQV